MAVDRMTHVSADYVVACLALTVSVGNLLFLLWAERRRRNRVPNLLDNKAFDHDSVQLEADTLPHTTIGGTRVKRTYTDADAESWYDRD